VLAIRATVRSNPLSEKIPVTVLQETIEEIKSEIKSQITLSVSVAGNRYQWHQRIRDWTATVEGEGRGGDEEGGSGAVVVPRDVREEIESVVKKSLAIPVGKTTPSSTELGLILSTLSLPLSF
jgi:hypothetical protein